MDCIRVVKRIAGEAPDLGKPQHVDPASYNYGFRQALQLVLEDFEEESWDEAENLE